jgi:leucyl-tRNA synthetase
MGHESTLAYEPFPAADPDLLRIDTVTYPVQVNGKVRGRIEISSDASEDEVRAAALAEVVSVMDGRDPRKVIVVPGRMVSVVV